MGARLDGTVGVHGTTADIDASFSDILEDLDAGFMGLFTAQKGPWSFGLEVVYMKLESEASGGVTGPGGVAPPLGSGAPSCRRPRDPIRFADDGRVP
jgi:hypothetical protein